MPHADNRSKCHPKGHVHRHPFVFGFLAFHEEVPRSNVENGDVCPAPPIPRAFNPSLAMFAPASWDQPRPLIEFAGAGENRQLRITSGIFVDVDALEALILVGSSIVRNPLWTG